MNTIFKRLDKPRIVKYAPSLNGHELPERTQENSSIVGVFVDKLVRHWARTSTGGTTVDLVQFGIEVKSQDVKTGSNWTIGTMTFDDIINTEYVDSCIYLKLQALFLVKYDNDLRIITDSNLYYFDNDEVQTILKKAYDTARKEAIAFKMKFTQAQANNLCVFNNPKMEFKNSQQFKGTPGYCFEYNNSGTSFKFRISNREMKKITMISNFVNNTLMDSA